MNAPFGASTTAQQREAQRQERERERLEKERVEREEQNQLSEEQREEIREAVRIHPLDYIGDCVGYSIRGTVD